MRDYQRDENQLVEYEAREDEPGELLSDLHLQIRTKTELLRWITRARSWRYTAWLRRLNFLSIARRSWLRLPTRDSFYGNLEEPGEGATVSQRLMIKGWVYSQGSRIIRVEVFLDAITLGSLRYGHTRLDAAAYPSRAPAKCGYQDTLRVDESLLGPRTLTVRVTDLRGRIKDYERLVHVVESADQPAVVSPPITRATQQNARLDVSCRDDLSLAKERLETMSKFSLESLLISDSVIEFPEHERPVTSVVLVLYNRAELTLQCLYSLLKHQRSPYEVIIVNNASTDETAALLGRIRGARIIENETNLHYLHACNQAARLARGEYILLLNNDAQLLSDCISVAVETMRSSDDIGAVGGRVILPDGTLQEAGSIIWRDGSCLGYGRGDSPIAPEYMFRRDVDYCSGVFLLTRRDVFLEGGGFDETFAPAYYEDTDYCVSLWKRDLRVVYDPRVSVLHYEFASSGSRENALNLQAQHQKIFAEKHRDWLRAQHSFATGALEARTKRRPGQKRILYFDNRVPHVYLGAGCPRSNGILSELVRMGHQVTCYPLINPDEEWFDVYQDIPLEVEVIVGRGIQELEEFLAERSAEYDLIYVSRPHNMAVLKPLLAKYPQHCNGARIVYDAEAVFSLREFEHLRLKGKPLSESEREERISTEVQLAQDCHSIISVSETEGREFVSRGLSNVRTLGHMLSAVPTPKSFEERKDILFVGSTHDPDSPNADSVAWFVNKVFPGVQKALGKDVALLIAGHASHEFFGELSNGRIKVLGHLEDLTELYDRARLFIAPTRFSAGLPYKAHEAAANGLPIVATTLIGRQLGWADRQELLVADDPEPFAEACIELYRNQELWERLRRNALGRVETDCCPKSFAASLKAIIE